MKLSELIERLNELQADGNGFKEVAVYVPEIGDYTIKSIDMDFTTIDINVE